jgi:hypothetical protein
MQPLALAECSKIVGVTGARHTELMLYMVCSPGGVVCLAETARKGGVLVLMAKTAGTWGSVALSSVRWRHCIRSM